MGNRDLERSLKDYEEIYGRPTPVRYDILQFSEEHRRLDALLRRYYDTLHPLVKDLFTSFALEFQYLLTEMEKTKEEIESVKKDYTGKQHALDQEKDDKLRKMRDQIINLENSVSPLHEEIKDLEQQTKELNQIIDQKDNLILEQRKELTILMEEESIKLDNIRHEQKETITDTIEHVALFTVRLENIEKEMTMVNQQKDRLEVENEKLKDNMRTSEAQFLGDIEEMNRLYAGLEKEVNELKLDINNKEKEITDNRKVVQTALKDKEDLSFRVNNLKKLMAQLKQENEEYINQINELIEENESLTHKIEKFKSLGSKILELKEKNTVQFEETESLQTMTTAEQPASVPNKTIKPPEKPLKWKPNQKTSLEMELEYEIQDNQPTEIMVTEVDDPTTDTQEIREVDQFVDRFGSYAEHDLMKSIREPKSQEKSNETSTDPSSTEQIEDPHILDIPGDAPSHLDNMLKEREPEMGEGLMKMQQSLTGADVNNEGSNFERMVGKLPSDDVDELRKFVNDFPKPPEVPPKSKKNEDESDNHKSEIQA